MAEQSSEILGRNANLRVTLPESAGDDGTGRDDGDDRHDNQQRRRREQTRRTLWQMFASIVIIFGFLGTVYWFPALESYVWGQSVAQQVAEAIAADQRRPVGTEEDARDFADVERRLGSLDVAPAAPNHPRASGLETRSARSTRIADRRAAAMRMESPRGRTATLYALGAWEEAREVFDHEFTIDGMEIAVWREGDFVFGLAQSASR